MQPWSNRLHLRTRTAGPPLMPRCRVLLRVTPSQRLRSVLHILAFSAGTPAPPLAATAASPVFACLVASTALVRRRGPDEGVVHHDLLLEELQAIAIFHGSFRFVEGGVLDEDVALDTGYHWCSLHERALRTLT
jgi:hypothetical protein